MTSFDAIIIGAGHNGLVAAGFLAKAGRKVLVLEASDKAGGAMGLGHVINRLSPEVTRSLGIDTSAFAGELLPTVVLDPERGPVILRGGYGETVEGVSTEEARAWAGMSEAGKRRPSRLRDQFAALSSATASPFQSASKR